MLMVQKIATTEDEGMAYRVDDISIFEIALSASK